MGNLKATKKWKEKLRTIRDETWGTQCSLCGAQGSLVLHNKNGEHHKNRGATIVPEALKNPDEWVRLCRLPCHDGVHFCMNHLGMSWDAIILKYL